MRPSCNIMKNLPLLIVLISVWSFAWARFRRRVHHSHHRRSHRNNRPISDTDQCPERLEWKNIMFVEDTQTLRLQLCCGVTKIWWTELLNDWELNQTRSSSPVNNWRYVDNMTLPGFDLTLSKCPGGKMVLGEVVDNTNCTIEHGSIITLGRGDFHLPEFSKWYVMCYWLARHRCAVCDLDKLCARCRQRYVRIEIVNATLTSLTVLVDVGGPLPFDADVRVQLDEASYRREGAGAGARAGTAAAVHERRFRLPKSNSGAMWQSTPDFDAESTFSKSNFASRLTDLRPDTWYVANVCVTVDAAQAAEAARRRAPPTLAMTLGGGGGGGSLRGRRTFCAQEESRTLWTRRQRQQQHKTSAAADVMAGWRTMGIVVVAAAAFCTLPSW